MALNTDPDVARLDDAGLDTLIRVQSDYVFAAAEKLARKREDVKEARRTLKREERLYDLAVAEAERRRGK